MVNKTPLIKLLLALTIIKLSTSQILSQIPITFQIKGQTTYTPDLGGTTVNGYILKLGYLNKPWLGIEFVGQTKSDVLILEIDDFFTPNDNPIFSGHQITVTDYYKDSQGLHLDTVIDKDISAFGYSNTKDYNLEFKRFQGSNDGEDWNAPLYKYSMSQICFYSDEKTFTILSLDSSGKQCYYFQVENYISTFRGAYLKQFAANGYKTTIFGYIDGPYLTDNIFLYQNTPLFTYLQEPAVVLEIGTTSGNHGQDFQVWSPAPSETGDYYGQEVTQMEKDNTQNGGYDNQALSAKFWNAVPAQQISEVPTTNMMITFRRNITTYDSYDRKLMSTFSFCLYIYATGSINSQLTDKSCEVVELSYHYPRAFVKISFGDRFGIQTVVLALIAIVYLIFN